MEMLKLTSIFLKFWENLWKNTHRKRRLFHCHGETSLEWIHQGPDPTSTWEPDPAQRNALLGMSCLSRAGNFFLGLAWRWSWSNIYKYSCIHLYINITHKYCSLNVRTSRIALFSKRRAVTTSPPMKFQTAEHRKFLGSLNLSQGAPPLAEIYTPCPESTNVFMTPTGRNGPKVQMLGLLACDRLLAWLKNSQPQFQ